MATMSSRYFSDVRSGNVFIGSTAAAGTALPISTGTAVTFGLWNTSTAYDAVLIDIDIGYTSGTIAIGEFGIANQYCGFAIATAAPLSTFTDGTPKNAYLGLGNASAMRFTPSAATLTAGGTAAKWLGGSNEIATASPGVSNMHYEFNGKLIVPPGQLVFLCGSVAQTGLFTASMTWAEVLRS
ncbi:MAG: hypothetical protein JWM16_6347 [Verrucomicrobiales bacterium]|nr:hypothetical protein [Verrucomicrobiales bacterium]